MDRLNTEAMQTQPTALMHAGLCLYAVLLLTCMAFAAQVHSAMQLSGRLLDVCL